MSEPPHRTITGTPGEIRTFLIADVRGYTQFTLQRGDEAATTLARRFAGIAREIIESRGGSVIELRGDEALCVFSSARQAIIAAIHLQDRLVDETAADPEYPLPVGIGLDAGEAVPLEGGYRGGALNLAARLCGQAGPGEILASQGVVHLAGKVEGVRFLNRGTVRLKNISEPAALVRVLPDTGDPAERLRSYWQPPPAPPRRRRTRATAMAVGLAVVVIAAAVIFVLGRESPGGTIAAGAIGFLEAATGRLTGQTPLGDAPGAIAEGAGAVWVTDALGGTTARIDPSTGAVHQWIPVGPGPGGVAVSAGHVWVTNSDTRTVSRVNPGSAPGEERVVAQVAVGNGPFGIAADGDQLWVANSVDATVTQIDARTGQVVGTHPVGALPTGVAVGGGAVWVTERGEDAVAKIDPSTGDVLVEASVGRGPTGIAWGSDAIWVANTEDGTVSRVDPQSASVTSTVPVGRAPVSVAAAGGWIWVANAGDGSISRLDPATMALESYTVQNSPRVLAAVGDSVWVAVEASAASHQGGALTVAAGVPPPGDLDPATMFDLYELDLRGPIYAATNDGLVAFRKVGGIGGSTVVPDLATQLPRPLDDGRTYTFVLRSGIKFSDGTEVGPDDVKATFERLLSQPGAPNNIFIRYGTVIEGASNCSPQGCDLSRGIEIDHASRTVTFHLTKPDPDFLRHLALPTFVILPAETPAYLGGEVPPATGPYRVASRAPLVLERNPQFREWSLDAQPVGFPDQIVFRFGVSPDEQVEAIEQGVLDAMFFDGDLLPTTERLEEVQTRFPDQVHPASSLTTLGFFLNVEVPPFDRPDVREAVALALDREELVRVVGAAFPGSTSSVTCNILAPNVPGYVPYCPHTLNPDELGTYSGPDLPRARRLVEESGTRGMTITVWSADPPHFRGSADVVVETLRGLGYRASLRVVPADAYEASVRDPSSKAQIGVVAMDANSASPSEFIRDGFACPRPAFHPPWNLTGFCDPKIDRRIDEALALQETDQYAAAQAWAALDRDLVDLAPVVMFAVPGAPRIVSERVGNFQYNPILGVLLSQLWVR